MTRDPKTRAILEGARSGAFLLALSMESDDGSEGDLYLERSNEHLLGLWGDTVVEGAIDANGALSLRDAGTHESVFSGNWDGRALRGSLRAEGEERGVRSVALGELEHISDKLTFGEPRRSLVIEIERGKLKSSTTMRYVAPRPESSKTPARLEDGTLVVTDERAEWTLHRTSTGLVGRSPSGFVVRGVFRDRDEGAPLPYRDGGLQLSSNRFRRGARGTKCEIDLALPEVQGTPADKELTKALQKQCIGAAAGMGAEGEPAPTLAAFTCAPDPAIPLKIQTSELAVTALPAGFVGLRLSGYARFSDAGGVTVISQCLLLDSRRGALITDVLAALPEAARDRIRRHVERSLRRDQRASKLTIDDFYTADGLETLAGATGCATASGLRVLVPLGVITKMMPTGPLVADVPRKVVIEQLPPDHPLRSALGG